MNVVCMVTISGSIVHDFTLVKVKGYEERRGEGRVRRIEEELGVRVRR